MTENRSILIFDLDGEKFGLDAIQVLESIWLPELTAIEEAPAYIVGIFSLRGRIVPVTDLRLRFNHPARPYRIEDHIVVLEHDNALMGLIVSEVVEVAELDMRLIQPVPQFRDQSHRAERLVTAEARVGDSLIALLDAEALMWPMDEISARPAGHFCPEAGEQERLIYLERARALMDFSTDTEETQLSLAVVRLGGEYFGIDLGLIQEFCDITATAAIPCCPPHILGAINLRGNLLTLIDISSALGLAQSSPEKAIIARLDQQLLGIAVDEIRDVVYLKPGEIGAVPSALGERHGKETVGTACYGDGMMTILDIAALLARDDWIVNETV